LNMFEWVHSFKSHRFSTIWECYRILWSYSTFFRQRPPKFSVFPIERHTFAQLILEYGCKIINHIVDETNGSGWRAAM
jgi:hypothetical protein